jgi:hypothetical protein
MNELSGKLSFEIHQNNGTWKYISALSKLGVPKELPGSER